MLGHPSKRSVEHRSLRVSSSHSRYIPSKIYIMHFTQCIALLAASSSLASAGVIQLTERDIIGRQASQSINAAFKKAGKLSVHRIVNALEHALISSQLLGHLRRPGHPEQLRRCRYQQARLWSGHSGEQHEVGCHRADPGPVQLLRI